MAAVKEAGYYRETNPVDLIEQVAQMNDWSYERQSDDELTMVVQGTLSDYHLSLNWRDDLETLHAACAFEFKVPDRRMNEVYRLIATINEQLWVGHFDHWRQEGLIMFRHSLMLNEAVATRAQCDALVRAALQACERYFEAFQYVVWAGKPSRDALASTMFETEGHA